MNAFKSRLAIRVAGLIVVALACIAAARTARAQRAEPLPDELKGVGVAEHLNAKIPLDLEFKDEDGRLVRLGQYFQPKRPTLLTLNYYECPMLCTLQLNGLIDVLREMSWLPGREFELVTVSFNPLETPTLARLKKQNYIKQYGRGEAAKGWHFLTGPPESIKALTEAVGFGYRWNEQRREFAHVAAAMVCTPDGRISRYLYGVQFEPRTVRLSLVEAGEGRVGSPVDQVLLYCYHYDAARGRYGPAAMNIMRAGGLATVMGLGIPLFVFWRREFRRAKSKRQVSPL